MRKNSAVAKVKNYTRVCSHCYKTPAGTYRVRVKGLSLYFTKRNEALKCRRDLLGINA